VHAEAHMTTVAEMVEEWYPVGSSTEVASHDARLHVQLNGRSISVINYRGKLFCLDAVCFHAGGPLTLGDIEEIDGKPCVSCPWHKYLITLSEGDKLYDSMVMTKGRLVPGGWKAMPQLQRTHAVRHGSDGQIWVRIDVNDSPEVRSDSYATDSRAAVAGFGNCLISIDAPPVACPP
jgi:nitrite reductase/ring-hydroxylating ferredoxin subunit